MDVGEHVDILVEGVEFALAEVVDDDVREIDFPHNQTRNNSVIIRKRPSL